MNKKPPVAQLVVVSLIALSIVMLVLFPKVGNVAWPYLIAGISAMCFMGGYTNLKRAKSSLKWPSVDGVISVSEIKEKRSTSSKGRSNRSYEFEVEYDYLVEENAYSNNLYSYQVTYNAANAAGARKLTEKYPVGSGVEVFYDPADPGKSVLLPGVNLGTYLPFVAGLVFVGFAFFMFQS